ncbi:acyl-CoA dehydrogenase [Dietzia natronolimnaea]|uniref:Acyl-CoA dehydrogenase n=1 Tax=Dietzia natronolimnaea TaxID=161920 RepID=A0A2A2WTD7_9ACTN|nr:acyl-CoA dehydrogenase family protein [Dietzia natronolimnaea]PAY24303.1 acyl-CoA dehydrogenase [Dietzia natronolimnaea]
MPINLSTEQKDLAETLDDVWSGIAPGHDVWPSIRELGLTEIPFPEATGGADGTFRDLTVVMTGLGRVLGSAPYFSSVVMAGLALLDAADRDTRAELLPGIVSGARTAALVCGPGIVTSAIRGEVAGEGELSLTGEQHAVVDGESAELLVVVTHGPDGTELALVEGSAPGVRRSVGEQLDGTRPLATVEFDGATARRISGPDVASRLEEVCSRVLIALAAEQVGLARRCLEMAVEYAGARQQFGRTIGSFQGIKHKLVDLLVAIELAEVTVLEASGGAERSCDEASAAELADRAAAARVLASRAAMTAAEEAIQVHGGIGFTWEHPLHHYFRRAKADQLLFGDEYPYVQSVGESLVLGREVTHEAQEGIRLTGAVGR